MSEQYQIPLLNNEELAVVAGARVKNLIYFAGMSGVTIANSKINPNGNPYQGAPGLQRKVAKDEGIGLSTLGTTAYSDLTLMGCSYTDTITGRVVTLANDRFRSGGANSSTQGNTDGIGAGFYLNIETVLITVSQAITVVKTKIQGRNGTVKEYIGADDAQITINGMITSVNGVYPTDDVNRLKAWLDAPVSKGVVARWLGNLGIDNVVVDSYNIPQGEGSYSQQMFSVQCSADLPVQLKITVPIQ